MGLEFGATFTDRAGPQSVSFRVDVPAGMTATVDPAGAVVFARGAEVIGRIDPPRLLAGPDGGGVEGMPVSVTVVSHEQPGSEEPGPSATVAPSPTASAEPTPSVEPTAAPTAGPPVEPAASEVPMAPAEPAPSSVPSPTPSTASPTASAPAPSPTAPPMPVEGGPFVVTYAVDPALFAEPTTPFPLTLDPVICTVRGASTTAACTEPIVGSPNSFDTYIGSSQASSYPVGTGSMIRVGYDDNAVAGDTGTNWGTMRGLVYIDDENLVDALPDGATVVTADLRLREDMNAGAGGSKVYARLVGKPGFSGTSTWNSVAGQMDDTYTSPAVAPCNSAGTDCYLTLDVTDITRAHFTKRAQDWKGNYGFQLLYDTESTSRKETTFFKSSDTSNSDVNRPVLVIRYELMDTEIDFDPALGTTYAPSTMTAAVTTVLPVNVSSGSSTSSWDRCTSGSDTDCYQVGYRFFNAKGDLYIDATGTKYQGFADWLSGVTTLGPNSSTGLIPLTITPPPTAGAYTMRLDVVRRYGAAGAGAKYVWSSDWADPSKFNARNKKVLTTDSTRWTGASVVERDDFSITVGTGDAPGDPQSVTDGAGGEVGIDLATKNLSYAGDTGLGFADYLPLGVGYTYNSGNAGPCVGYQGVLGACGWSTEWDERISPGPNATGYDYTYVDPDGQRHFVDTDGAGQLTSSAPVLLERIRATFADETKPPTAATTLLGSGDGFAPWYGSSMVRVDANSSVSLGNPSPASPVGLNTQRFARFAMRATTGVTSSALCFVIHNVSDASINDGLYCYTTGTDWTTGQRGQTNLPASISGQWAFNSRDLLDDVRNDGDFGGLYDEYQVVNIQIRSKTGWSGTKYTYLDAARLEASSSIVADVVDDEIDSTINWTSGGGSASDNETDSPFENEPTLQVAPTTWTTSPTCANTGGSPCWATDRGATWSNPFASWWWKKSGGSTAAVSMQFFDETWDTSEGWIVYYAGPNPPANVPDCPGTTTPCVVQVSPVIPTTWTRVIRNVREDARQVLGIYTDKAKKDAGGNLVQPGPDPVRMTAWKVTAADGARLNVTAFRLTSIPDIGRKTASGQPDQWLAPGVAGSSAFTYDFRATYPDGSVHYLNEVGLLSRIADADGNHQDLVYTTSTTVPGQAGQKLSTIRSASDGMTLSSGTANRELVISTGSDTITTADDTVRFDEAIGSTSSDASARAAIFAVLPAAANGKTATGLSATATSTGGDKAFGPVFYPKEGSQIKISGTASPTSGTRTFGVTCPEKGLSTTSTAFPTGGSFSNVTVTAPAGGSATGCRAFISTTLASFSISSTTLTWTHAYGDLEAVSPARDAKASGASVDACTTGGAGCTNFQYTDVSAHRLSTIRDPRYTGTNLFALGVTWDTSAGGAIAPTAVTDASRGNSALLKVLSWDNNTDGAASRFYRRPLFQTAPNVVASAAQYHELSPDGSVRRTFVAKACTAGNCITGAPSGFTADVDLLKATESTFDGLSRSSATITYRCNATAVAGPGGTLICTGGGASGERISVSRSGSGSARRSTTTSIRSRHRVPPGSSPPSSSSPRCATRQASIPTTTGPRSSTTGGTARSRSESRCSTRGPITRRPSCRPPGSRTTGASTSRPERSPIP